MDRVSIPTDTYEFLIKDSMALQAILNAIFDGAKLRFDGEAIYFGGDLEPIIRALYPNEYVETLERLKGEENGTD